MAAIPVARGVDGGLGVGVASGVAADTDEEPEPTADAGRDAGGRAIPPSSVRSARRFMIASLERRSVLPSIMGGARVPGPRTGDDVRLREPAS